MTRPLKPVLVLVVLAACVALPFAVHCHYRSLVREREAFPQPPTGPLPEAAPENDVPANAVGQADGSHMSRAELAELLRLRNEINRLREQVEAMRHLRAENLQLQDRPVHSPQRPLASLSVAERNEALSGETVQAMKNIFAELPSAMQKYAHDHDGRPPEQFLQLRGYFPTNGGRMPGLYTFDFARDQGPKPGDTLILRESGTRSLADGRVARVYALSDGTVLEKISSEPDLESWEKEHLAAADPPR